MNKNITFISVLLFIMLIVLNCFGVRCYKAEREVEVLKTNIDEYYHELEYASRTIEELELIIQDQCVEITNMNMSIKSYENTISELKNIEYELVYLGDFKLTHYCTERREHICGTGAGITATGTQVTAGRTIAVDPNVIPYGTEVYIEGYGWRVAEDCGGAVNGNHIDIAVETHSKAMSIGTISGGVWILVKRLS